VAVEVWLVRHGQTPNNITGERLYNAPLTALGRAQAGRLAVALGDQGVTSVLSSPLLRAMETGVAIAAASGLPLHVSNDLVEINRWDPYIGASAAQLRSRFPGAALERDMPADGWTYPGPEPDASAQGRIRRVVATVAALPAGSRVALVGHGTLNGRLLAAWLGAAAREGPVFTQDNACINHLTIAPGRLTLHRCNDTGHLAGIEAPPA